MTEEKVNEAALKLRDLFTKQPQFTRDSPLDVAFKDLYESIISKLQSLKTYESLGFADNELFVRKLLHLFMNIHAITCDEQRSNPGDLLPVSLHDIRYLEVLITLIMSHGIDANLPEDMRILQNHREVGYIVPNSHKRNLDTLALVIDTLYPVFVPKSMPDDDYIRSVILKGPLYPEMVVGTMTLYLSQRDSKYEQYSRELENVQATYGLFTIYPSLVQSVKNTRAHAILLERLSTLPVRRDDGLLNILDFVTGARENEQVDTEKIDRFTQLLVAKPKNIKSFDYFTKLFTQVRAQLSYINRPVVITCLNNLITTIYCKNPRIIHDFLFKPIYEVLFNRPVKDRSYTELNNTINMLISLTKNTSTEIINAVTIGYDRNEFYVHLWIYALFLRKDQGIKPLLCDSDGNKIKDDSSPYYSVILSLLKSYMVLTGYFEALNILSLNLINFEHSEWKYSIDLETRLAFMSIKDKHDKISDELALPHRQETTVIELFDDMNIAVEMFITLLKQTGNKEVTKNLFLNVLSRWVKSTTKKVNNTLIDEKSNSTLILMDLKILEQMNREFTSDIVKDPKDVLIVIEELIDFLAEEETKYSRNNEDSDDEEDETRVEKEDDDSLEPFGILMDLLAAILDEASKVDLSAAKSSMQRIRLKLINVNSPRCDMLEKKVSAVLLDISTNANEYPNIHREKESLEKVMAQLSDPLEPIKVQGLTTLSNLIKDRSQIIPYSKAKQIFLQHLKDPDPFVYLNAVKGLALLCEVDKDETLECLIKLYLNLDQKGKMDDILKIGEVFTRYIQRENEAFVGPHAERIVDACLLMIRQHDTLDNRIRMSAISLLGICLRVNARGLHEKVSLVLDCVFGILQLETSAKDKNKNKNDTFVVRRAAIHLISDLLWDNGLSILPERYNRQKLTTLLQYVREQDEDTLVREHASNILEELNGTS